MGGESPREVDELAGEKRMKETLYWGLISLKTKKQKEKDNGYI